MITKAEPTSAKPTCANRENVEEILPLNTSAAMERPSKAAIVNTTTEEMSIENFPRSETVKAEFYRSSSSPLPMQLRH
jgi:hypothetical protein